MLAFPCTIILEDACVAWRSRIEMPTSCRFLLALTLALALRVPATAQQPEAPSRGAVRGQVVDQANHLLGDATVTLSAWTVGTEIETAPVVETTLTDAEGTFRFPDVVPGTYIIVAELANYERFTHSPFAVTAGREVSVQANLRVGVIRETLQIVGSVDADTPTAKEEFGTNLLEVFRLPTDRFQEVLPQLPGVVRDSRGRISFNGTRPSQSALLVNGTTATDPVTGEFAVELPLKAVETIEVFTIPYSAEFGRATGAVANVRTRAGDDHWDVDFGNLWPSLRFRDGALQGINSATPRVQVSGPLSRGRMWVSQGFSYRFVRSRVYDVAPDEVDDEEVLEGFDSFTQLDVVFGDRHAATATFSIFPVETDNLGIDTLTPAHATPEFSSTGWNLALADRVTSSSNTLWETTLALRRFDVQTARQGLGPARLTVDGLRNNYFNEIDRDSTQAEFSLSCLHFLAGPFGPHLMKVGGNFYYTSFTGTDHSFPIEFLDAAGRLQQRVTFGGAGAIEASDVAIAGYVQDQWRPTTNLALDLGLRYDFERITGAHLLSPRLAFAYSPAPGGGTVIKGGWGLFFDQVFLHADSFEQFQERREDRFDPASGRLLGTTTFRNALAADGLSVPRSATWNLELDQQLSERWMVRMNYRERRARHEMIVDRLPHSVAGPILRLSSTGRSMIREFDVTARRRMAGDNSLFMSFSRRRTTGDLNDFGSLYGSLRNPLLLDSEDGRQPFDVPSRFLLWGTIDLPKDFILAPAIEWRSGFPYTVFDEAFGVVGRRNDAGRYPAFLSADMRLTKAVSLLGKRARVGVELLNLTNRSNPRDVVNNLASPSFGAFRNSVDLSVRLRLELSL